VSLRLRVRPFRPAAGAQWLLAAVLLTAASIRPDAARADWIRAETDRFIVYGDGSEQKIRDYAVKLTTYDATLRLMNPRAAQRPSVQKLEVYFVRSRNSLRRVRPGLPKEVGGFYNTSPDGVFAIGLTAAEGVDATEVLFHEYAHHFMLEHFPAAYPAWFVEGWAEFYMTTEITPKIVKIGGYNLNRAAWLFNSPWLKMEEVLSKTPADLKNSDASLYYAQAWLLMHYMLDSPVRAAQLDNATSAIAAGEDPVKAFTAATGMDMAALTKALKAYTRLNVLTTSTPLKAPPTVIITRLPPSADEFLLDGLRLSTSSAPKADPQFLDDLRKRAAKYPGDRLADITLARAEFAMGDVAAGEAIINRRLAANPEDVDALRAGATGLIRAGLRDPARRQERFRAARAFAGRGYQLDKDDYRILYAYARGRTVEDNFPSDNDISALMAARALAPAVAETSILAGQALLARGRRDEAKRVLTAAANNPHGGAAAVFAQALIKGETSAAAQAAAEAAEAEAND
jgi:hypothetical protein